MRETSVQLASVTNAEQSTTPLASAVSGALICQSTATAIRRPSTPLPTSPMKMRARGKLNGRNPAAAAANTSISPACGSPTCRQSSASEASTKIACAARMPSMPSMKLCRFTNQTIASATTTSEIQIVETDVAKPSSTASGESATAAMTGSKKISVATQCAPNRHAAERPR